MDRVYVRTCSAAQATALARGEGRLARIGSASVMVHRPAGREPIDRDSSSRYLARVEVLDTEPAQGPPADPDVVKVLSELFGEYLG
jgi:hypothetical protein